MSTTAYTADDDRMHAAAEVAREVAAEALCRDFARQHPGRNVDLAIAHAEAGDLTWRQIERLFTNSLSKALAEVRREVTGR